MKHHAWLLIYTRSALILQHCFLESSFFRNSGRNCRISLIKAMQRIEKFSGYDLATVLNSLFCYKLPKRTPDSEPPPDSWLFVGCEGTHLYSISKLFSWRNIVLCWTQIWNLATTVLVLSVCMCDFYSRHMRQVCPHPPIDKEAPLFLLCWKSKV